MSFEPSTTHLIVPVGTQIVTRIPTPTGPAGSVAEIVAAPTDATHAYAVRFLSGHTTHLRREDFSIRKQHQWTETPELEEYELDRYVIFRCIVGSRAYGLDTDSSDTDRRGIFLPPASRHWSLFGVPEQIEHKVTEECYWELKKFLILALKANPNVLECLYTPLVETATPLARNLLEMRSMFLSRLVYQTYNGYVMSQFKKIEQDLRTQGTVKWKHAMHLIRLLMSGIALLRDGVVTVHVGDRRDELLAIKRGEIAWDDVNRRRLDLHREFDAALAHTALPERPDYDAANDFLIRARREAAREE